MRRTANDVLTKVRRIMIFLGCRVEITRIARVSDRCMDGIEKNDLKNVVIAFSLDHGCAQ